MTTNISPYVFVGLQIPEPTDIVRMVCNLFNVSFDRITSKDRHVYLVDARCVAVECITKVFPALSNRQIATYIRVHRTSVNHYRDRHIQTMRYYSDGDYAGKYLEIMAQLNSIIGMVNLGKTG